MCVCVRARARVRACVRACKKIRPSYAGYAKFQKISAGDAEDIENVSLFLLPSGLHFNHFVEG